MIKCYILALNILIDNANGGFVMAKKTNFKVNGKEYYRVTRTIGKKSDGTPLRKTFYGIGINDANQKADEYLESINKGMSSDFKDLDINNLCDIWLYNIKIKDTNFKAGSFSKYEGIYRNYIRDSDIGFLKVFSCKTINIQRFYNKLSENGKTESQIKNLNKVLKGAFNYAVQEGYCLNNPCQFVSIPKNEVTDFDEIDDDDDNDYFELEDINKIISECNKRIKNKDTDYLPYLILFSIGTGLRQGESTGLQYKYFLDYTVYVKKELCKIKKFKGKECIGYEYKLITPKTPNSIRNIDIPTYLFDIIEQYINDIVINNYKQNHIDFNDKSLIFVTNTCSFIDQSNLRKRWIRFLKDVNVEYKKWHALRSAFACLLFLCGADIKTVQELLGHADINTTAKIYLHIFPETKKDAVNRLNEKLELY